MKFFMSFNGYRYKPENWSKLLNDELDSPLSRTEILSNKIMLIAGKDDRQINVADLSTYAQKYSIQNFLILEKGHITPSRIDSDFLKEIVSFFE